MATETHTARRPVLAVLPRITGLLNRAVTIALLALLVLWLAVNLVHGPGQFGSVLLIGFTNGALYALIALGYTLVYGIIELINFAHGDVFMIGTMLSLTLLTWVPSILGVRRASLLPTTHLSSARGSTSPSTAAPTRSTRWRRRRCPLAPTTRGATRSCRSRRGSTANSRRSAR